MPRAAKHNATPPSDDDDDHATPPPKSADLKVWPPIAIPPPATVPSVGTSFLAEEPKPGDPDYVPRLADYSDRTHDEYGNKIPRPLNAWIMFRKETILLYRKQHPEAKPAQKDLSKDVGSHWKHAGAAYQETYNAVAKLAYAEHCRRFPGYKFRPEKKTDKVKRLAAEKEAKAVAKRSKDVAGGVKRNTRRRAGGRLPSVSASASATASPPPDTADLFTFGDHSAPSTSQVTPAPQSQFSFLPDTTTFAGFPASIPMPMGLPFIDPSQQFVDSAMFQFPLQDPSAPSYDNVNFAAMNMFAAHEPSAQIISGADGVYDIGALDGNMGSALDPWAGFVVSLGSFADNFFQNLPTTSEPLTVGNAGMSTLLANLNTCHGFKGSNDDEANILPPGFAQTLSSPPDHALPSPSLPSDGESVDGNISPTSAPHLLVSPSPSMSPPPVPTTRPEIVETSPPFIAYKPHRAAGGNRRRVAASWA